jgi:diguanylate cyclase (GGDEF)-like protein
MEAMICMASPTDLAREVYYTGLILVVLAFYTWIYIRIVYAVAIGLLFVGVHMVIASAVHGIGRTEEWPVLLANSFFLISANIIGFAVITLRDRYLRENYLLKHSLERELEAKEVARQQNEFLARHDPLTSLPNRHFFKDSLERAMDEARSEGLAVAVLFIDLDGFKRINDSLGHAVGDQVLKIVAKRLRACVRESDTLGRLGGDEFVVCLTLAPGEHGVAKRIATKIADALSGPIRENGSDLRISASIGVAYYPFHGENADRVLYAADRQMYEAKGAGKASIRVAPVPEAA